MFTCTVALVWKMSQLPLALKPAERTDCAARGAVLAALAGVAAEALAVERRTATIAAVTSLGFQREADMNPARAGRSAPLDRVRILGDRATHSHAHESWIHSTEPSRAPSRGCAP